MLLNSKIKRLRLLTIGSVSPMNGGSTQGRSSHTALNDQSRFFQKSDLNIELVGTIATNSKSDKDMVKEYRTTIGTRGNLFWIVCLGLLI